MDSPGGCKPSKQLAPEPLQELPAVMWKPRVLAVVHEPHQTIRTLTSNATGLLREPATTSALAIDAQNGTPRVWTDALGK